MSQSEQPDPDTAIRSLAEHSRYHANGFYFVRDAVVYTVEKQTNSRNHVSGRELLEGIRDYALEQYGPMALSVLEEWGIHRTEDFGNIVFAMIRHRLLQGSPQDRIEEFVDGYDFNDTFSKPFRASGPPRTPPVID